MTANLALANDAAFVGDGQTITGSEWSANGLSTTVEEFDDHSRGWATTYQLYDLVPLRLTVPRRVPIWLSDVVARLNDLLRLEQNWDGYGSCAPQADAGAYLLALLAEVSESDMQPPQIVPTASGGFQMEWHESDIDLEVEMRSDGSCEVSFDDLREVTRSRELELEFPHTELSRVLRSYLRQLTTRSTTG